MRSTCRMLVLTGLAVLLQLVLFGPSVSLAQSAEQPGNAQRAVPTAPPGPTSGYVYVPPQTSAPAQAQPPNYCAPPWQVGTYNGQNYCEMAPPCPFEEQPLNGGEIPVGFPGIVCCPPGWVGLFGGPSTNPFCCPRGSNVMTSAGYCGSVSFASGTASIVPTNTMALSATVVTCPQGSQSAITTCLAPLTCPPGYTDVNNQCVTLLGTGPAPPPATPAVPLQDLPHLPPRCMAGQVWTSINGCCAAAQATSKGLCCPAGQVPKDDGSCGFPPATQNANQIPPPVEQYVMPPQGPAAVPTTVPNVTSVLQNSPGPQCGPPATLLALTPAYGEGWITNPFTGQTQPPGLDVCKTPAQGCPTGWHAAGVVSPPSAKFYCCPDGKSAHAGGVCCPPGGPPSGSEANLGCVRPVPANCSSGGVAIGNANPFCVTPAICPRDYTLTGTTCCPSSMVSPLGACCPPGTTCCPPGYVAEKDGSCWSFQSTLKANPAPPPVEQYVMPPQRPAVPSATVPKVTSVSPYPGPICGPGATVTTLTGAATGGTVTNPFTGQTQTTGLDVCTTPASGCPAGTVAASTPIALGSTPAPSSLYFCCPADKRVYWTNGQCCPPGALPDSAGAGCVVGQVATCNGQAVAIGGANPVCATPASCQNGYTFTGATCCPNNMVSSVGTCCPPGSPPRAGGDCRPPPPPSPALNATQIPPGIEEYKVPPQVPVATPTVPNVTQVSPYPPGPTCAPPATLVTDNSPIALWPGQTTTPIDACRVPAPACPPGTWASGPTIPPTSTYYCCPTGMRSAGHDTGRCCPLAAPGSDAICGGPTVPATAMSCAAGGIARSLPTQPATLVCETLALCPSGSTLTGTACCPNNMVSSLGTCCPPGSPPRAGGGCTLNPLQQNVNVPSAPVVNLVACPNGLVRRDAFDGDRVCVTTATREQIIVDNTASPSRTLPDGNCRRGFVWREAGPRDHACVRPASHTQVSIDNRQQCGGDLHCRDGVVSRPTSTKTVGDKPPRVTFRPHDPRREPPPRTRTDKPRGTSGHPMSFHTTTWRNHR